MASSVDLGSQLEAFVSQLVKTGRYNSRSKIWHEGVRIIHEREARLVALDAAIARGLEDADAGRVHQLCARGRGASEASRRGTRRCARMVDLVGHRVAAGRAV